MSPAAMGSREEVRGAWFTLLKVSWRCVRDVKRCDGFTSPWTIRQIFCLRFTDKDMKT